jgi:hypothetical protein
VAFQNTTCLFSTVRNVSGQTIFFGFLPPHGRLLAPNQEFSVFGNILEAVIRAERVTSRRHLAALEAAIANGLMIIKHTPNPILLDDTTAAIKMLDLNNGTLGAASPCWANAGGGQGPSSI